MFKPNKEIIKKFEVYLHNCTTWRGRQPELVENYLTEEPKPNYTLLFIELAIYWVKKVKNWDELKAVQSRVRDPFQRCSSIGGTDFIHKNKDMQKIMFKKILELIKAEDELDIKKVEDYLYGYGSFARLKLKKILSKKVDDFEEIEERKGIWPFRRNIKRKIPMKKKIEYKQNKNREELILELEAKIALL